MNKIVSNIIEKAIETAVKKAPWVTVMNEYNARKGEGGKIDWDRQATLYNAKEIKDWQRAVMAATDPYYPLRGQLMKFYQGLKLDNHLCSVVDTRILRVQRSSFKIVNETTGEENPELEALLRRPWHEQLIRLVLFAKFQGTTLIELFDTDASGELLRVNEIPQTNFIPQKGIVIKMEGMQDGISYVDGAYQNYYLQVGDSWDLGMYNELAMIVIAKKLGLGSWMAYIDKYGIPPMFVNTENMDDKRAQELFNMMKGFRSNNFALLKGSEKITIPQSYINDSYQSFQALSQHCNNEMSKRVLGGTALSDEKSFSGAANVQLKVAEDRYEADKLTYEYYFNKEIKTRLAKISSVYADFATHKLVWDNQETLDINGYLDAISKLATNFEFDTEEIKARTGLPITGTKEVAAPMPTPAAPPTDPQKKKPNANIGFGTFLHYEPYAIANPRAATWDAASERLAKQIYNGEVSPADLDRDLVLKYYAGFNKTAASAWGDGYYTDDKPRQFRENLLDFSGAKSYSLMQSLQDAKTENGRGDINSYIDKAKSIVSQHNEQWGATENNFINASVSGARDYDGYLNDVDIYPNLVCRTMEDDRVRETHAINDGVVKRVEDWVDIPPFEPGCRCRLDQTTEKVTERGLQGLSEKWANNPIKTGRIFPETSSYFSDIPQNMRTKVDNNTELMKQFAPYNTVFDTKSGQKVYVNDFADPSDLAQNKPIAEKVADFLKKNVYIRPHSQTTIGAKNPEFGIGTPNIFGDLKTFSAKINGKEANIDNFITNAIYKCNKQGCTYAVLDVTSCDNTDLNALLKRKLCGNITPSVNKNIQQVIVVKGNKTVKISRKQILARDLNDLNAI